MRNISGIMQFYATVKGTTPITDVYYAGCMDDDFEVSMDGIRNMNLQVHPLKVDIPMEIRKKLIFHAMELLSRTRRRESTCTAHGRNRVQRRVRRERVSERLSSFLHGRL